MVRVNHRRRKVTVTTVHGIRVGGCDIAELSANKVVDRCPRQRIRLRAIRIHALWTDVSNLSRNKRRLDHLLSTVLAHAVHAPRLGVRIDLNLARSTDGALAILASTVVATTTSIATVGPLHLVPLKLALDTLAVGSVADKGEDRTDAFDKLRIELERDCKYSCVLVDSPQYVGWARRNLERSAHNSCRKNHAKASQGDCGSRTPL